MALKLDQLENDPEALAKVSIKDLSIAGGISVEKSLLLAGNPTRIVESRTDRDRYEWAIDRFIKEMKEAGHEVDRKTNRIFGLFT